MRPALALVTGALALTAMTGMTACSGDDGGGTTDVDTSTPVPETASAPFLCPGVPAGALELMTGRTDLTTSAGAQDALGIEDRFRCAVGSAEGTVASVTAGDSNLLFSQSAQDYVRAVTANEEQPEPLTEPALGSGVVAGTDAPTLTWACPSGAVLRVTLDAPAQGRDAREDVTRFGRSLLDAACAPAAPTSRPSPLSDPTGGTSAEPT